MRKRLPIVLLPVVVVIVAAAMVVAWHRQTTMDASVTTRHVKQWWSVHPGPWSARADDVCTTIEPPTRDKALQLSAYRNQAGDVTRTELERMAAKSGVGPGAKPVRYGDFVGLADAHRNEQTGSWWRQWYLASGPVILYVTYIAEDQASSDRDFPTVEKILGTLRREQ